MNQQLNILAMAALAFSFTAATPPTKPVLNRTGPDNPYGVRPLPVPPKFIDRDNMNL